MKFYEVVTKRMLIRKNKKNKLLNGSNIVITASLYL